MERRNGRLWRLALVVSAVLLVDLIAAAFTPPLILSSFKDAMVFVESEGLRYNGNKETEQGSGFFISTSGLVLTSYHLTLIPDKQKYQTIKTVVRIGSGSAQPMPVTIVNADPKNDLVLLRLTSSLPNLSTVVLGDSTKVSAGEDVTVLGFPVGDPDVHINRGIVSAKKPDRWHSDASVVPGSSGGPVFDGEGKVVAVVWGGYTIARGGANAYLPLVEFVPIELFYKGIGKTASGAFSTRPPVVPSAQPSTISKAYPVAVTSATRAVGPGTYEMQFPSEPRYRMTTARVVTYGADAVSNVTSTITPNGDAAVVRLTVAGNVDPQGSVYASLLTRQTRTAN